MEHCVTVLLSLFVIYLQLYGALGMKPNIIIFFVDDVSRHCFSDT